MKNICCLPCISRLVPGKVSFVTLKGSNRKGGCFGKLVLTHACCIAHMSFHTRVFSHISVSNSSLLWTKALACKTISTVTLFVLLITYAHIWEIGDTLSVPCHHTRARAFTFFPTFPWRVTYSIKKTNTWESSPRPFLCDKNIFTKIMIHINDLVHESFLSTLFFEVIFFITYLSTKCHWLFSLSYFTFWPIEQSLSG